MTGVNVAWSMTSLTGREALKHSALQPMKNFAIAYSKKLATKLLQRRCIRAFGLAAVPIFITGIAGAMAGAISENTRGLPLKNNALSATNWSNTSTKSKIAVHHVTEQRQQSPLGIQHSMFDAGSSMFSIQRVVRALTASAQTIVADVGACQ